MTDSVIFWLFGVIVVVALFHIAGYLQQIVAATNRKEDKKEDKSPHLRDAQVVVAGDGDLLIFTIDMPLRAEQREALRTHIKTAVGERRVFVMEGGLRLDSVVQYPQSPHPKQP